MGLTDRLAGAVDEAMGLAKRAAGELGGRPDLVLEGEAQQGRGGRRAAAASQADRSARSGSVVGWKLDRAQRQALIVRFPPRYGSVVADHVTLRVEAGSGALPPRCEARIVGRVDDGAGVEAMVVAIDGSTSRPDGGTYHVTWSLAPGRRAKESNDAIARLGWDPLPDAVPLALEPARF